MERTEETHDDNHGNGNEHVGRKASTQPGDDRSFKSVDEREVLGQEGVLDRDANRRSALCESTLEG